MNNRLLKGAALAAFIICLSGSSALHAKSLYGFEAKLPTGQIKPFDDSTIKNLKNILAITYNIKPKDLSISYSFYDSKTKKVATKEITDESVKLPLDKKKYPQQRGPLIVKSSVDITVSLQNGRGQLFIKNALRRAEQALDDLGRLLNRKTNDRKTVEFRKDFAKLQGDLENLINDALSASVN